MYSFVWYVFHKEITNLKLLLHPINFIKSLQYHSVWGELRLHAVVCKTLLNINIKIYFNSCLNLDVVTSALLYLRVQP